MKDRNCPKREWKSGIPAIVLKADGAAEDTTDDTGIIECIVSVFDVEDSYGDVIKPGAFVASLKKRLPKGVWCHDWTQPVAKTLEARELQAGDVLLPESIKPYGGLYIKGQFNLDTQRGREAHSDVKKGLIDEFSIGFRVKNWTYDVDQDVWELNEIDLYEWSPVLVGANPETAILSVKDGLHAGLSLSDHSEAVLAAVEGLNARLKDHTALRTKDGRVLSEANRTRLAGHRDTVRVCGDAMHQCADDIDALLTETDTAKDEPAEEAKTGEAADIRLLSVKELDLRMAALEA